MMQRKGQKYISGCSFSGGSWSRSQLGLSFVELTCSAQDLGGLSFRDFLGGTFTPGTSITSLRPLLMSFPLGVVLHTPKRCIPVNYWYVLISSTRRCTVSSTLLFHFFLSGFNVAKQIISRWKKSCFEVTGVQYWEPVWPGYSIRFNAKTNI